MITDQFAIELDVGESFVNKAPTSESLLRYTEVFCSFGFCKEYRGREGIHICLHIQVEQRRLCMSCTGNQLNYGNTFVKGICLGTLVPSTVPNTVPRNYLLLLNDISVLYLKNS